MDSELRKKALEKLRENPSNQVMTGIPLRYKGESRREIVWKIPLDCLIYNKYNGRIGSLVLSYEAQNGELNPEIESDAKIIADFLYESKKDRNKATMTNLLKNGQQRYGIVTANGIIIDGNRRAMLLNRLYHDRNVEKYSCQEVERCQYFLAIILPDDAEEKDIQQLETIYQMGEDDKLDYNPIEKYLKCGELKRLGFSEKDIAEFMGESPGQIKKWLRILKLMDEYLNVYGYEHIYTRLEKTEGPFVDLEGYLESYEKRKANTPQWLYTDQDINDLKGVCFDYIRARYEGKEFRDIAKTGKGGSIFYHEKLWKDFLNNHINDITPICNEEPEVEELRQEKPNESLSDLLRARDATWKNKVQGKLKSNLSRYTRKLDDIREKIKPGELLERALNDLEMVVKCQEDSFFNIPDIEDKINKIKSKCEEMEKRLGRK